MKKRGTRARIVGSDKLVCPKSKRSQVTVFVIVAVIVVALAVLIYFLYPKISAVFSLETKSPSAYLQSCLEADMQNAIKTISSQGGSLNPENYYLYNNSKLEYLCYTNQFYVTCVVQRPLLKQHVEEEIKNSIKTRATECVDSMKKNYGNQGYEVSYQGSDFSVELLPKRVLVIFNNSLTLKKTETEKFDNINFAIMNNLYDLVTIASSIISFEAHYGDSETTIYMNYYRDLKVEKYKQSEGTTVYILTDRNTGEKFQFASRSVAWPPGYATQ